MFNDYKEEINDNNNGVNISIKNDVNDDYIFFYKEILNNPEIQNALTWKQFKKKKITLFILFLLENKSNRIKTFIFTLK